MLAAARLRPIRQPSYAAEVLADAPLLYWRLGEASGTTAADASGNGRTGTYGAGITLGQPGLLARDANKSALFNDNATSVVTSAYNPFAGQRTFEGWAYRTNVAGFDVLFSSDGANLAQLYANSGGSTVVWYPGGSVSWATALLAATITHWVLTYDDTTRLAELWINGVSKGVQTVATGYGASPGNFRAGRDLSPFGGRQDELAIYSGILSASRVLAHRQAGI